MFVSSLIFCRKGKKRKFEILNLLSLPHQRGYFETNHFSRDSKSHVCPQQVIQNSNWTELPRNMQILSLIILDEAIKELVNFMFGKRNQKITQVFTLSTDWKEDVVCDFQDSALPGPIHNQTVAVRQMSKNFRYFWSFSQIWKCKWPSFQTSVCAFLWVHQPRTTTTKSWFALLK